MKEFQNLRELIDIIARNILYLTPTNLDTFRYIQQKSYEHLGRNNLEKKEITEMYKTLKEF